MQSRDGKWYKKKKSRGSKSVRRLK